MKTGDIIETTIESIATGGAGIGRWDDRPIFIDYTAPGDRVRASILEDRNTYYRATMTELIQTSDQRVAAICPYFGQCGGCSLQHLSPSGQIAAKTSILREACQKIGGFTTDEVRVFTSPVFEYRNRMQFHRVERAKTGTPRVGLKKRLSETVLPLEDCPIAEASIRTAMKTGSLAVPPAINRFTVYARTPLFLSEAARERGQITLLGKDIQIDVRCFFQNNATALETLIGELLSASDIVPKKKRALDLYGGIGTFSVFLADRFEHIDLVERDRRSVALAKANVGDRAEFFALSDEDWVKQTESRADYDFIVVDPPRTGLSRRTISWLETRRAATLAYVSCDPATFARDAGILLKKAYVLRSLSLFDFYPQTSHLESMAIFQPMP